MSTTSSPPTSQLLYGHKKSQAVLEFALSFPILLIIVFGIIDFSLLFAAWLSVQNVARQAVRYAATGQYNPAYCVDGPDAGVEPCAGEGKNAEVDAARLQSIHDEANRFLYLMMITNGALQNQKGYINIIVCSSRDLSDPPDNSPDLVFFPSRMGDLASDAYARCRYNNNDIQDAGSPGDRVIVAVDFNHPFLTPFINYTWPLYHLASSREAIVERFRVARVINVPPSIALPTPTASKTPTPSPLFIDIIVPDVDGTILSTANDTRFEAVAYDPGVNPSSPQNGDGILQVEFWFNGPTGISGSTDGAVRYCAFGGNGPCNTIESLMSFYTLAPGTYTIWARATAYDGVRTAVTSKTFIIVATKTPTITLTPTVTKTPTMTSTATSTPTPDCSQFSSIAPTATTSSGRPRITFSISSNYPAGSTYANTWVQTVTFNWSPYKALNSSQDLRRWYYDTLLIDSNTARTGTADMTASPYTWDKSPGVTSLNTDLLAGETDNFNFDFNDSDASWPQLPGTSFGYEVVLGNGCRLSFDPQSTSTPTITRTPTMTRTITLTPTVTRTPTVTFTPTITLTPTITRTPTVTFTPTITRTPTRTPTVTLTPTITLTPTKTWTPTITLTPTKTATSTWTFTPTITRTPTPSFTPTPTRTITLTPTKSATPTKTKTPTPTNTYAPSITPTSTPRCIDC
jgi:hypothetical protein